MENKSTIFYGCVIDRMLPSIGEGVVKVLNKYNINTIIPENLYVVASLLLPVET